MNHAFLLEIRPSPVAHARALLAALVVDGHAATLAFERGAFPFEIQLHAHRHRQGVIVRVTTAGGTVARARLRPGWRTSELVFETARVLTRALRRLAARPEALRGEVAVQPVARVVDPGTALEDAMRERLARRDGERERRKSRRPEPGLFRRLLRRLRLV